MTVGWPGHQDTGEPGYRASVRRGRREYVTAGMK
jgi:hypothetical protein